MTESQSYRLIDQENMGLGKHAAAEAMQQLANEIEAWRQILDRLEAGHAINRAEGNAALSRLLDASQHLRDMLLASEGEIHCETKADLELLVCKIDRSDAMKSKYERLAQVLSSGTVTHRRERIRAERLKLRDAAVAELKAICALPSPPELIGPDVEEWLEWAWRLLDDSEELQVLQTLLPCVDSFLGEVDSNSWLSITASLGSTQSVLPDNGDTQSRGHELNDVADAEEEPQESVFDRPEAHPKMTAESAAAEATAVVSEPGDAQVTLDEAFAEAGKLALESTGVSDEVSVHVEANSEYLSSADVADRVVNVPTISHGNPQHSVENSQETLPLDCENLLSFEEYRANHFVTFNGIVTGAPWSKDGFESQLNGLIIENLHIAGMPILLLAVRAMDGLGRACLLTPESVKQAAELIRTGKSLYGQREEHLFAIWRDALLSTSESASGSNTAAPIGAKLLAFVHAFSSNSPLHPDNLFGKDDFVRFASPSLRVALEIFYKRSLTTNMWVEHLRDRLDSDQEDRRQVLANRIVKAKSKLRTAFQDRTIPRGIQRPHCKEAWTMFMKKIAKERSSLLLDAQRDWALAPLQIDIERWKRIYTDTMDNAEAKYQDRHKMDRAFQELNDLATELTQMLHAWNTVPISQDHGDIDSTTIGQLSALLTSDPLADPEEELCRLIARSVLRGQLCESVRMDLTLRDFIDRPHLLELITELPGTLKGELGEPVSLESIVGLDDIREPIRVVARFLEGTSIRSTDDADLLSIFREALSLSRRGDLEDRLIPLMGEPEKRKLVNNRRLEVDALQESASLIRAFGGQLADFAAPQADLVREAANSLQKIVQTVGRPSYELVLVQAWAQQILASSQELVSSRAELLRREFNTHVGVLDALGRKDYALATLLSGLGMTEVKRQRLRETMWRKEARTHLPDPYATLGLVADSATTNLPRLEQNAAKLADVWRKAKLNNEGSAKRLRTAFLDFVFQSKKSNAPLSKLFSDKPHRRCHTIDCQEIRVVIAEEEANPSYFPQLADYGSLSIVTPDNISVGSIVNSVKHLGEDICVVLSPHAAEQVRLDVRQRIGTKLVAVIDHLDLCRLLDLRKSTEISPLFGLMEIILEQQSWDRVDPYRTQDGQHVRMEMFVGRTEEGERLAKTNDFKKLFSGRKLGKSALLRYVKDKYDNSELPSGNRLRVLYIPIVDHFQEDDFVRCMITEIQTACNYKMWSSQESGWKRLQKGIRDLLEDNRNLSLLIVLDEADKFVEEELKNYIRKYEECLSFHLRSDIENTTDNRQLPRVRFLFAGYRTTNISEGAWSNWGDTLRLSPLDSVDAAALLAGPLARMGIDLRDHAGTMAFRCGYQPAVLLRAGKALLTRMSKQRPLDSWEYIEVKREDINAVLEDQQIRSEIQQVIDNNFTQNKLGQIVFHITVFLLSERQFGYALEDPEAQIMAELKKHDPNGQINSWLTADERSAMNRITIQLEELQQRRLLVAETGQGEPVRYRLAFPHHVSVFGGQQQLSSRIQHEIHQLSSTALHLGGKRALSFFADDEIDSFRRAIKESESEPKETRIVRGLFAISHWLEPSEQNPALHPSCGVHALVRSDRGGERRAVSAESAVRTIDDRSDLLILVGGADLLRWSLGEPDDEYFYLYAMVRRFGKDELKAWFGILYEIDLTNLQLEGILKLTAGIPMLVGQLHRLVIPSPGDPPDKLDEMRWKRIQTEFAACLPHVALDLQNGPPSVRLTIREIEILKMVVYVSDLAYVGSIVEDLTDGWDMFEVPGVERPKCKHLGDEDEASVMLLQSLGLLPMRRAFGLRAIEAILPLEADDTLRQVVRHL